MKMPFGKYKGKALLTIAEEDIGYIVWLSSIDLFSNLKAVVNDLLIQFKDEVYDYREAQENQLDALSSWDKN